MSFVRTVSPNIVICSGGYPEHQVHAQDKERISHGHGATINNHIFVKFCLRTKYTSCFLLFLWLSFLISNTTRSLLRYNLISCQTVAATAALFHFTTPSDPSATRWNSDPSCCSRFGCPKCLLIVMRVRERERKRAPHFAAAVSARHISFCLGFNSVVVSQREVIMASTTALDCTPIVSGALN